MKIIVIFFFGVCSWLYLSAYVSPVFAAIIVLSFIGFGVWYIHKWEEKQELIRLATLQESFYIVSSNPKGGNRFFIEDYEIYKLVIFCNRYEIEETARKYEGKLAMSGNSLFSHTVKSGARVQVYRLFYREGENINENYEDYQYRVLDFIKEDRKKHHIKLKRAGNGSFYTANLLNQKGVVFSK